MHKKSSTPIVLFTTVIFLILSGCFTILNINQPSTVSINETFDVDFIVETEPDPVYGWDDDAHYAIIGMMIPLDWDVNSVSFRGIDLDPEEMTCSFLHPDSADAEPGGQVDYWTDSLNVHFPPPEGMHWVVYQSDDSVRTLSEETSNDVYITFTSGTTEGTFDIGYFVSNAALDFSEDHWYDVSLGNTLTVSDISSVFADQGLPVHFSLMQNFPNPFNPETRIVYSLSEPSEVRLTLHDLQGRELRTIQQGFKNAGSHFVSFDAGQLASGVYLYRLSAGENVTTRKLMVIK